MGSLNGWLHSRIAMMDCQQQLNENIHRKNTFAPLTLPHSEEAMPRKTGLGIMAHQMAPPKNHKKIRTVHNVGSKCKKYCRLLQLVWLQTQMICPGTSCINSILLLDRVLTDLRRWHSIQIYLDLSTASVADNHRHSNANPLEQTWGGVANKAECR